MQTTTNIIPSAIQECSLVAYQYDLTDVWQPFYDAAMRKFAGLTESGDNTRSNNRSRSAKARAPRGGISKAGQAILGCLIDEGMPKRQIIAATGLTAAQYEAGVKSLERGKLIYWRNGRCFKGAPPTRAASAGASGARQRAVKSPTGLSEACLTALRELPAGATNEQIRGHVAKALNRPVRPNHIGAALARHKRGGRAEQRDNKWFLPGIEESREAA